MKNPNDHEAADLTIGELHAELAALIANGVDPATSFVVWQKAGNLKHLRTRTVAYNPAFGVYAKASDAR